MTRTPRQGEENVVAAAKGRGTCRRANLNLGGKKMVGCEGRRVVPSLPRMFCYLVDVGREIGRAQQNARLLGVKAGEERRPGT